MLPSLPSRQYGLLHTETNPKQRIVVGVSGGVDSAVAALLLKQAGHDVVGVFMRNWDEAEETGNRNCSIERDLKDASAVCRQLNIPLHEADFVSQYWNHVFSHFLSECSRGLTPNPDLACNRYIKFGALLEFARSLGAEAVATGHYARLQKASVPGGGVDGPVALLKGVDSAKDQSYFLASVEVEALRHVMFPVGGYTKGEVRRMAAEAGLGPVVEKRSSAGICFIGRRKFSDFLSEYLPPILGKFIDVDSGGERGECENVGAVTFGQRPGIGGVATRTYVAGKDMNKKVVYVAVGKDHPALFTRTACLREPHWLSTVHRELVASKGELRCEYKARYGQPALPCTIKVMGARNGMEFTPSAFCGLLEADAVVGPGFLVVEFDEPAASITPQQMFVMYDGDVCIGSAAIALPGQTVFEEERHTKRGGRVKRTYPYTD